MQLNKDYESEINLRSLIFYVLYRWRSVLIIAFMAAVLLGGYKFVSMKKAENATKTSAQTEQNVLSKEEEQKYRKKIDEQEKHIKELEAYLNDSIYIRQSPKGIWTASSKYLLMSDVSAKEVLSQSLYIDPADSILPAYSYPLSGAKAEELSDIFFTDKNEYIDELVETEIHTDENTITISVKGSTKESAQKGLEYVKSRIESISTDAQKIGSHSLINVGDNIVLATDRKLQDKKTRLTTDLEQDRKDLQGLYQSLNDLRANGDLGVRKETILKFALIGFFLGIFLIIGLYVIRYLTSGKLINGSKFTEQYNLPVFGEFMRSGSIHKEKGFDKLLSKWELGQNRVDPETTYDNICVIIHESQEINNLLLVSTLKEEKIKLVKEALAVRIPEKKIDAKGNFITNSEAISEAANTDAVILVEEKGTSLNKDIERTAEMLMISRANVIGAIVL